MIDPYRTSIGSSWQEQELWDILDEALALSSVDPYTAYDIARDVWSDSRPNLRDPIGFPEVRRSAEALMSALFQTTDSGEDYLPP